MSEQETIRSLLQMPEGEWTEIPFTEADKQWLEQQDLIMQKIIKAFGIPPSLLGIVSEVHHTKKDYLIPWLKMMSEE